MTTLGPLGPINAEQVVAQLCAIYLNLQHDGAVEFSGGRRARVLDGLAMLSRLEQDELLRAVKACINGTNPIPPATFQLARRIADALTQYAPSA
jgi:hypothetical protein